MLDLLPGDALSAPDGRLHVDGLPVADLAARFGTPLYVVAEPALRANVRRYATAFAAAWPHGPTRVLVSVKASLAVAVLRVVVDEGAGLDVVGPGELEAALRAGADPGCVSLNGSGKDEALVERALRAGTRITLDSLREADLVRRVADRLGVRAAVRLRLRPDYAELTAPTDYAGVGEPVREVVDRYRPGIPAEDLAVGGAALLAAPELDVRGFHAHLGRLRADLGTWRGMARAYARAIAGCCEAWGYAPREIDLGGGFAAPRDPIGGARAPSPEEYAAAAAGTLRRELSALGVALAGVALELEPGRAVHASAGVHLARVRNVKRQTRPTARRWVETDTSEQFLLDVLIERARFPVVAADRLDDDPAERCDVTGISCGFDLIAADVGLPEVGPGELLAFLDTGAYQEAAATNFDALARPATVLVGDGRADVIRRRETLDDVFRRDLVPARLANGDGRAGRVAGLHHAGLTVADLDRALAFYHGLLGIPLRAPAGRSEGEPVATIVGAPGAALRIADLELPDGRLLELLQYERPLLPPAAASHLQPGTGHLALRVADVHALAALLRARGHDVLSEPVRLGDEEAGWAGVTVVYARDPDGNVVELVEVPA